jgi:hypothetical protein
LAIWFVHTIAAWNQHWSRWSPSSAQFLLISLFNTLYLQYRQPRYILNPPNLSNWWILFACCDSWMADSPMFIFQEFFFLDLAHHIIVDNTTNVHVSQGTLTWIILQTIRSPVVCFHFHVVVTSPLDVIVVVRKSIAWRCRVNQLNKPNFLMKQNKKKVGLIYLLSNHFSLCLYFNYHRCCRLVLMCVLRWWWRWLPAKRYQQMWWLTDQHEVIELMDVWRFETWILVLTFLENGSSSCWNP